VAQPTVRKKWGEVKARLEAVDRKGLVSLIADLYDANPANRRFLHSRLRPASDDIDEYRRLVIEAISPDPFSTRRVSIRDAGAAIAAYQRATSDVCGTVDLLLTFVEAGTDYAADLGYGDEAFFSALSRRLNEVVKAFESLPPDARASTRTRLGVVQQRARQVGWGFEDDVDSAGRVLDAPALQGKRGKGGR